MLAKRPVSIGIVLCAGLFVLTGGMCGVTQPPGGNGTPDPDFSALLAIQPDDHVLGDPNAPGTVIEFADFECPVCGRFDRETFPTIRSEFIDTGAVKWVFRHFPLRSIHPCAEAASRGSECAADQDLFWEFHERLFSNQNDLCNADLKNHGVAVGLETTSFNACIDSGEKAPRVQRDLDNGKAATVSSTPTFFINGRKVVGFQTVDQMRVELNR